MVILLGVTAIFIISFICPMKSLFKLELNDIIYFGREALLKVYYE